MRWHVVDGGGLDPATGREPAPPGEDSPAAAVARCPVATWPLAVLGTDGRRLSLGEALGDGGDGVERLVEALHCAGGGQDAPIAALAASTPAGPVDLPMAVVPVAAGAEAAEAVEPGWLAAVEQRRAAAQPALVAAGRGIELEAALHLVMLLATQLLDPEDDADVAQHVSSGAMLWLLAGAAAWCLLSPGGGPFAAWGELVAKGWWPVGPTGGRLVVARPSRRPPWALSAGIQGRA